ncbi:MAG: amino acid ABC transporter permease [Cellulosilyticum sp.]|nr:amino acid ABC transporter permease [Cellulosilyticum sp.]
MYTKGGEKLEDFFINLVGQQTVDFYKIFFENRYYTAIWQGLQWTLGLTAIALIIGLIIGVLVALIQITEVRRRKGILNTIAFYTLRVLKWISSLYIYIIRGTPSALQIVLMWTVVFATSSLPRIIIGGIAFGINSGAYMAELIRAGIQGIDKGQTEAGRSLGLSYVLTMRYIILPQAFKQMLPALVSEFICLIKETAIIGFIGGLDLMKAQSIIQSRTYNALQPLLMVGLCYLIITSVLTFFMKRLEKKLNKSR